MYSWQDGVILLRLVLVKHTLDITMPVPLVWGIRLGMWSHMANSTMKFGSAVGCSISAVMGAFSTLAAIAALISWMLVGCTEL